MLHKLKTPFTFIYHYTVTYTVKTHLLLLIWDTVWCSDRHFATVINLAAPQLFSLILTYSLVDRIFILECFLQSWCEMYPSSVLSIIMYSPSNNSWNVDDLIAMRVQGIFVWLVWFWFFACFSGGLFDYFFNFQDYFHSKLDQFLTKYKRSFFNIHIPR